ncbi:hypothetical protein PR202_ga10074 [Eleusine coracana subsp. coracana]|uniref:chitinase n=1 Tax=Eleusine coracana subsp. coracana TaxID=191504 RepID=A0AAV5C5U2_ELECO|nr:hypothetical protein PR202_ga10074 [Eleusine coracana subsp. coracana]
MMFVTLYLSSSLLLALHALAAAASGAVDIAVYWGQNASEGTLGETCGTGLYTYVNLAFLSTFGASRAPLLNLAGHCDAASGACASLAADVASCQSAGIKVLLSIGGGATGGYNLSSPADAQAVAAYIWDSFLGGSAATPRPLGDAVLDGVDFDIEAPSPHYDDLARSLTSLFTNGDAAGRKKKYVLAAAPQCPFPDASLGTALGTGLFDRVWVQFYNNPPCQYASGGDVGGLRSAWEQWTASLPSATVFLGLPASPDAAGGGFVDAETLVSEVLPVVESAANFGGVMLWSRSYDKDSGFSVKLHGILQNRDDQAKVMALEMVRAKRNIGIGADTTSTYFAQWLYEHLDQFCDSISDIQHGFCSLSLAQHAADGASPQMTGAHGRSAIGSQFGGAVLDATVQGEATTTASRKSIM